MELSNEAQEGLDYIVSKVKKYFNNSDKLSRKLKYFGIENLSDTFYFLAYVREKYPELYSKLDK